MKHFTLTALALALGCASSSTASTAQTTAPATAQTASAAGAQDEALPEVSVDQLAGMLERRENVAVYDANRRERYEQGHVPGARWVAHDGVNAEVLPTDRSTHLVFYCANTMCRASHTAARAARALGFANVSVLSAGIAGWTSANKPVVTGANPT